MTQKFEGFEWYEIWNAANKTKSFIGSLTAFSAAGRENDFPIWNAVVGLLPTFCRNTPSPLHAYGQLAQGVTAGSAIHFFSRPPALHWCGALRVYLFDGSP